MLMSTPGGQGCLISACWTIWLQSSSTGGPLSPQMTSSSPEEEGNSINWDTLDQDHFPSLFHDLQLCLIVFLHPDFFFFCLFFLPFMHASLHPPCFYYCCHNRDCDCEDECNADAPNKLSWKCGEQARQTSRPPLTGENGPSVCQNCPPPTSTGNMNLCYRKVHQLSFRRNAIKCKSN